MGYRGQEENGCIVQTVPRPWHYNKERSTICGTAFLSERARVNTDPQKNHLQLRKKDVGKAVQGLRATFFAMKIFGERRKTDLFSADEEKDAVFERMCRSFQIRGEPFFVAEIQYCRCIVVPGCIRSWKRYAVLILSRYIGS